MRAESRYDDRSAETPRPAGNEARSDYYITPTHDFTQYTKDYEAKYWSKETAFDWDQSISGNLKAYVERLPPQEFSRIATLALPFVNGAVERHIWQIRQIGLPLDDDALKAIGECIPSDRASIDQALVIQAPLERLQSPLAQLSDRLAILKRESLELREQQRLGLFKVGTAVRCRETEDERREQAAQVSSVTKQMDDLQRALKQSRAEVATQRERLKVSIRDQLKALERQVLADLEATGDLVRQTLHSKTPRMDGATLRQLQDLVLKRQLRGLKDIANHCVVVEQTAIAPLSVGIIHYKRRREIQEAMTTFVNDEAKHSAVFRRFMAQKLEARERIPDGLVKGGERYMWLARFMPSAGIFLAVIVEAIGGAYLEFFGVDEHMPDPLFRNICKTIAERDERRHMDLCAATYNELYRTGSRWERFRNEVALQLMMKAGYGDHTEQHPLLQACLAFGLESDRLYQHVAARLTQQLAKVGMYVQPEAILAFMRSSPQQR